MALLIPAIVIIVISEGASSLTTLDSPALLLASSTAMTIGTFAATWLARRLFDRRSLSSLGLTFDAHTFPDLLAGMAIAFSMMGTVFLIQLAAGWLTLEGWGWQQLSWQGTLINLLLSLVLYILVGFQEELLFRGYQLQNLVEGWSLPWALLTSSVLFALAHLSNPSANWNAFLGIALAGMLLALAWLRTRSLWLPIGLHIGWNFFEGTVFGFPVSGLGGFHLVRHRVDGPLLITGGAFGPEAGAVLLPGLILAAWIIVRCTRRRPPSLPPDASRSI